MKVYCRPTLQATHILNFVRHLTPLLFRITVPWDAATRTFDSYPNSCAHCSFFYVTINLNQNRTRYSTQQPQITFLGYSVMVNTTACPTERLWTSKAVASGFDPLYPNLPLVLTRSHEITRLFIIHSCVNLSSDIV